jgi:hypothetical protein
MAWSQVVTSNCGNGRGHIGCGLLTTSFAGLFMTWNVHLTFCLDTTFVNLEKARVTNRRTYIVYFTSTCDF